MKQKMRVTGLQKGHLLQIKHWGLGLLPVKVIYYPLLLYPGQDSICIAVKLAIPLQGLVDQGNMTFGIQE